MRYLFAICLISACQLLAVTPITSAEELRATFLMLSDPAFDEIPEFRQRLPQNIVEVWRNSLQRTEAFYRQSAAIDVRNAARAGFEEVKAAIPELQQLLRDENAGRAVHAAVAQALVELDAREAADELFNASRRSGTQLRQLVEPVLARWDYQPIRNVWRERLQSAATPRRELTLACEGSGQVRDEQALADLLAIVHSVERPNDVRLSAARAAGEITNHDLESDVQMLLADDSPSLIRRLCAAVLLKRHDSTQAREQLREMFRDPAGPVATAAIERLFAIDPAHVLDLTPEGWKHPEVKVRRVAADCLITLPDRERIRTLASHLHDAHPGLRSHIAEALLRFARQPEYEGTVRQNVVEILYSDNWRGQEQACLLLGELDQEDVAPRLVELLDSERPEVQVASAWALRKVAVAEVLPDMLDQAQSQTDDPQGKDLTAVDRQVAHLFESLTIMDYRPAIPLMRRHVPKEITHRRLCRGAAVWGLGHLLSDTGDEELAAQLMGRVKDLGNGEDPELEIVRRMGAVSLGRLKAQSQLQALKSFAGPEVGRYPPEAALRWAIHEISGEQIPFVKIRPRVLLDWRIQPASPE